LGSPGAVGPREEGKHTGPVVAREPAARVAKRKACGLCGRRGIVRMMRVVSIAARSM